ncbi:hypothetical protein AB4Z46_34985 [Variovorax sp. M-6]|uniref:hypothetical protein n=1 Tax=Variovorax sp. M-6 TaxID=3233041 RepID=UPI003F9C9E16
MIISPRTGKKLNATSADTAPKQSNQRRFVAVLGISWLSSSLARHRAAPLKAVKLDTGDFAVSTAFSEVKGF